MATNQGNTIDLTAGSGATCADFNSPQLGEKYERFLSLLGMAGLSDRLRAMDIRGDRGVEAAAEFLGECKLTSEASPRSSAAS
jgi:hypothetical protein